MTKIAAILPTDEVTEGTVDRLAKLKIDNLSWELLNEEDDAERILPAFGWPAGTTGQSGGVGAPVGLVTRTDYPEDKVLEEEGASGDVADYYAQTIAHGATAIVVDTPHEHRDRVQRTLESAGATNISWE